MKKLPFILLCIASIFSHTVHAQQDSSFDAKKLIIPTGLILTGTAATYSNWGQDLNSSIQGQLYTPGKHTKLDDYIALSPSAAVYVLNALGNKGKHSFTDRTVIIGTSYLMAYPIVIVTKEATGILRPDRSTYNSFPSGHTAIAFASAEFLRMEYKDVSVWYGIAGYTVATAVGGLRVYNNRHWFSDVLTGAGVGILSTQLAYIVQPWLSQKLFKRHYNNAMISPQLDKNSRGLVLSIRF